MISFEQAHQLALEHAEVLQTERVILDDACGRVLAEDVVARDPAPLFDNSAVDGFGVRVIDVADATEDRPIELRLARTIQAGEDADGCELLPGETAKILTGAMVPECVDAVIMREHVVERPEHIVVSAPVNSGQHIRRRGEEYGAAAPLLDAGTPITPAVVGLLATAGYPHVVVTRRPRVSLVVTGNEIRHPAEALDPGQIRDSNSYALSAALGRLGITPDVHRVADDRDVLSSTLAATLTDADVVITVGGVSVGDYDFVRDVLAELHVETVYWGVAMKPGKPNYLGRGAARDGRAPLVFGLPGNPVSAMVSFVMLVVPALRRMSGDCTAVDSAPRAALVCDYNRTAGREEFVRSRAIMRRDGHWEVEPLVGQGSHMGASLARANCLMRVPPEVSRLGAGDVIRVEWLL